MSNARTLRAIAPSRRKQWGTVDKAQAVGSRSRLCETWLYPFSDTGPWPGCSPSLRLIFLVCKRGEVKEESRDCFLQAKPYSESTHTHCGPHHLPEPWGRISAGTGSHWAPLSVGSLDTLPPELYSPYGPVDEGAFLMLLPCASFPWSICHHLIMSHSNVSVTSRLLYYVLLFKI